MPSSADSYWPVIEDAFYAVEATEKPKLFDQQMAAWPPYIQHLLAAHWCNSEICNGGFAQLFNNTTGIFAPIAVDGCRSMGRADCADVIAEAMRRFAPAFPRGFRKRRLILRVRRFDFDDLEKRWYGNFPTVPGLTDLLRASMGTYASIHR